MSKKFFPRENLIDEAIQLILELIFTRFDGKWKSNVKVQLKKKQIPQNLIFVIRKYWSFCDEVLQAASTLDKQLKIFVLVFSILIHLFSKIFSHSIFHLAVSFQQYQIYDFLKNI